MKYRPYRLIGERHRMNLRGALKPVFKGWAEDWLPDERWLAFGKLTPLSDYCHDGRMPKIKKMVSGENDHWCGLLKPANAERFGAMLTGTPEEQLDDQYPSILLGEVADQALIELAQRILTGTQESHDKTSFFVTDNILPKEASVLGSGAMVIWVKVGNLPFAYIVSPQIVENYLKSCDQPPQETRRKLVPVLSALDRQKVRANVSLGSAELSLGDLGTIQVGDVVTLNRRINEPSVMRFGANGIACKGFIGAKGKSLAFRISQIENKEYA